MKNATSRLVMAGMVTILMCTSAPADAQVALGPEVTVSDLGPGVGGRVVLAIGQYLGFPDDSPAVAENRLRGVASFDWFFPDNYDGYLQLNLDGLVYLYDLSESISLYTGAGIRLYSVDTGGFLETQSGFNLNTIGGIDLSLGGLSTYAELRLAPFGTVYGPRSALTAGVILGSF